MANAGRGAWTTLQVFISSTFADMWQERNHLVRFVFPALREELLTRRIHLVDVDLRWGLAPGNDVTAACKQSIDRCRPWFIGILGNRYGTLSEDQVSSITEQEIRYGVLEPKECGHAFFYLRQLESGVGMDERDRSQYFSTPGSREEAALGQLKADLAAKGLCCRTYQARWDATHRRVTGLQAFCAHVREDMMSSILRDNGLGTPAEVGMLAEERGAMEDFVQARTQHYVEGAHAHVLRQLHDFVRAADTPPLLIVQGPSGTGKSALLSRFYQQCTTQPGSPEGPLPGEPGARLVIPHFVGASTRSGDVRATLIRLCHELRAALPEEQRATFATPEEQPGEQLVTLYTQLLSEVGRSRRVLLLLDAVDQFGPATRVRTLDLIPRQLPEGVRIILSERTRVDPPRDKKHELDSVTGLLRFRAIDFNLLELEPLPQEDAKQLIEQVLAPYHKQLDPVHVAALMSKRHSGSPLYLRAALEELRTLASHEDIRHRIEQFPDEVRPLFQWILKQHLSSESIFEQEEGAAPGHGARIVREFVSFLGVSRRGLSHRQVVALIEPGDPRGDISALERLLRPYLMKRGVLLDFHHAQFREAVLEGFLSEEENRRFFHQKLADYLFNQVPRAPGNEEKEDDAHALREVVYHLTQAGDWERLAHILTHEAFLLALLERFGEESVFEDYLLAYDALSTASPKLSEQLVRDLAQLLSKHEKKKEKEEEKEKSPWLQLRSWSAFLVYRTGQPPDLYLRLLEAGASGENMSAAFAAHCQLRLGSLLRRRGELARAEELLRKASEGLRSEANRLRALAEYELGYLLFIRGEYPHEAAEHLHRSVQHSQAMSDVVGEHSSRCVEARVRFIFELMSAQEYLEVLEKARKVFKEKAAGSPPDSNAERWTVNVMAHLFEAAHAAGQPETAKRYLDELADCWWNIGVGRAQYLSLVRARYAMLVGDWPRALAHFGELPSSMSDWKANREGLAELYLDYGRALWAVGRWDEARSLWQQGLECPDEQGNRPWKERIRACLR